LEVRITVEALAELNAIQDVGEQNAMWNAISKLEVLGDRLPFPHARNVQGARNVWELRPRAGRSRWRALYRRIGDIIVIGAIGPEAEVNARGFKRAVAAAETRLDAEEAAEQEGP
jgi:hypothetical protein